MVAIQIRGVSEVTRRTLSAEAKARGESLQEYLLDVLDREAQEVAIVDCLPNGRLDQRRMNRSPSSLWN